MACKTTSSGASGRDELGGNVGGGAAGGMEIGWPTNVRHVAHVTFDRFNGFLGLPVEFEPDVPRRAPSASATVFGVSTESMQLSFDSRGNSIPTILLLLQRRLYAQGGLQAEGIFRINAENSQEEYVRDQVNRGTVPEGIDVHCLAGLIKTERLLEPLASMQIVIRQLNFNRPDNLAWFRELPRGVLDPISPEQIMQCQTMEDCAALVRLLPPSEGALLDWAINLMADVVQMEHLNKMNSRNIAMVFAPNMTQMADPLTALMYAVQVMNFIKTLVEKTLRDREDFVVEEASTSHREPYDENGRQSPELCMVDAPESIEEPEPLFIAEEPELEITCHQVDNISAEEYLSSSTSPEQYSDESGSSGTPIGPFTVTNLREHLVSGPKTDIKENIQESRTDQSSDSTQMNCTKKMEDACIVIRAIGVHNKSKGISNLSHINSLTERIEAWR